jgi:sporulation protein YlmC with PRC-barrel domain
MKRFPFIALLAILLFIPTQGVFALKNNSPAKKGIAGNLPKEDHINAFRADKIIGSKVINLEGENVGTIDELVIDIDTGNILYAALKSGGFMGLGDKLFAVPWRSLTAVPVEGIFIIDQSSAKLKKAPGFDKDNWPDVGDRSWRAGIYEFYRHNIPTFRVSSVPATQPKHEGHRGYPPYPGYATGPYPYQGVWQNVYGEMFDPKKIETVTGRILKVQFDEGLKLIIYTDAKKPVLVALGPTGYFEGQEMVFKPGDKVTVSGSRIIVDDTPLMIATKILDGNKEMKLRDNQGHPNWIGWRQIK